MERWLRKMAWVAVIIAGLYVAGCCWGRCHHRGHAGGPCMTKEGAPCAMQPAAAPAAAQEGRADVLYACDCGPACTCKSVGTEAGNCACGKPMKWHHVLKVEGSEAIVCGCAEGCSCALDPQDPGQCGCGMPVERLALQGTGVYFCNCGGACACNTLSAAAGECRCGMALKKVN